MANPIAEAFVRLRPDASQLGADTKTAVNQALGNVTVPASTSRKLGAATFGSAAFQASAQSRISAAMGGAQIPTATQGALAQKLFGPGFRNESGRAIQGVLAGIGQGQLAARFAFFGPGGAALATVGAGLLLAAKSAAQFEKSLSVLQAVTGATTEQLAQMEEEAKRLGASMELPAVTATDAANAMLELSKAGLGVEDVISGVEGSLQLATAANVDAATGARAIASALNAFSLEGSEAVRVADLLAGASIAASGDIGDMTLAMQQASAAAAAAGLSVQQTTGFITLLAKAGILGSDAGTSIRTSILRLVPTTKEAASFMEALGIQLDRTRTLGQQLPELLDQYNVALSALNPTLRQSVLQQIAGTDAYRALSIAIEAGGAGFKQNVIEADRQNAALELAQAQTSGLAGETNALVSSLQTLGVTIGQDVTPALELGVGGLRGITTFVIEADDAIKDFTGSVIEFIDPFTDLVNRFDQFAASQAERDPLADFLTGGDDLAERLKGDLIESGQLQSALLQEAIKLRATYLEIGLPTGKVDAQIAHLRGELKKLREEQGTDIGLDLATPLDQALERAKDMKKLFELLELPTAKIQAEIDFLTNRMRVGIVVASEQAARDAAARTQLARALGLSAADLARLAQTVQTEGKAAGVKLGKSLIDGMVGTITAEEGRAIRAAQQTLESVRREGEQQVIESIRSARGNLESLGESISGSLAEIIDVGPIGQAIEEIDEELEAFQERVSRRQLRFDTTQAEADLREAKFAIAQVGKLTPEQKKGQEEFLAPFVQKVQDAKAAAKEFDLEENRTELEKTRDQAVKTAEEGIVVLVDEFENGKLSADEFATKLRNQLNPQLKILNSVAGKDLGLAFTRDFMRDFKTILEQAKALRAFIGTPGTTPGPQAIRPAETQAQVNAQIAAALAALQQTEADALEVTKDERDKADIQIGLLRKLVQLSGGNPKAPKPRGELHGGKIS